jgi:L-histidine Nalpha-methyltransferase
MGVSGGLVNGGSLPKAKETVETVENNCVACNNPINRGVNEISNLVRMESLRHNLHMSSVANVTIHASQFPENVRRDLIESLRAGEVNHKFHYDSVKQTQKWLALRHAYSPSRTDADCAAIYDRSFEAVAKQVREKRVHVIGLGCGGGQKDTRLLKLLQERGKEVFYTPSDVSTAMVLVARKAALEVVPEESCHPLVCDLASAEDLPEVLDKFAVAKAARIITFFGMIPNFEQEVILPKLSGLLRSKDLLLFSANLAPGGDYGVGVQKILPLYDNALTRDWLMTFLLDIGVEPRDGEISIRIEDDRGNAGLKRVAAYFQFRQEREISIDDQRFRFGPEKPIRLFFSYRHTPKKVRSLLGNYGMEVTDEWIATSEEEGVFLCKRNE